MMAATIEKKRPYAGFAAGYKQLNDDDKLPVQMEIWQVLGINNRVSFGYYKNGWQQITDPEKKANVEEVFRRYGVDHPWGQ